MPLELQVKLLRVLETGRLMRVGSTQSQETDVRVIAATNRNPLQAVAQGRLREDLMYRLNVFPIELPPLRERLDDVVLLAEHFLGAFGAQEGSVKAFTDEARAQLVNYRWPGNVRELRNAVQRAYVMARGDTLDAQWLPRDEASPAAPVPAAAAVPAPAATNPGETAEETLVLPLGTSLAQAERALILATLRHHQHHKERTAAVLGISLKTLYNRLKEYAADGPPEVGEGAA
jgi:DNA-binding NtrC family response regulator